MNKFKKLIAAGVATVLLGIGVVGFTGSSDTTASNGAATSATTTAQSSSSSDASMPGGGRGGGISADSVTTEAQLVELIQEAYGEPSLGLHRGHQDVESTLIDVLGISHDEMHVRMEQGQNLAAVADDLGIDQQTLIDALVETRSSAIDTLLENGTITQEQADGYLDELEDAYTFRVTWDGQEATPTATTIS